MDPTAFGSFYSSLSATTISAGLRYPFPHTPDNTQGARTGMILYPQPLSVSETTAQPPTNPASSSSNQEEEVQKRPLDKKLRRQIANSNERRRMQSINSGFHTLRLLMPHLQGEKLSKASVLQHAAEHIFRLNQERERLIQQNTALRVMLTKYWSTTGGDAKSDGGSFPDSKVSKATSPILVDDEKAAAKELEEIFTTRHQLDVMKEELERERNLRLRAEAKNRALQDQLVSPEESEEGSDSEYFSRRKRPHDQSEPRNNLDIIVRAIRQIEGDAFSRSTTPTCASQERSSMFVPITTSTDGTSRVSPVTPVYAS